MKHSFSGSCGTLKCPLGCSELLVELVLEILGLNKKELFSKHFSVSLLFFGNTGDFLLSVASTF